MKKINWSLVIPMIIFGPPLIGFFVLCLAFSIGAMVQFARLGWLG